MIKRSNDSLNHIIDHEAIRTVFQPIVSLRDASILGYEALSRITYVCEIKSPDMLFVAAEAYNRLWDLEIVCRSKTLSAASEFITPDSDVKLFMNVNPKTLHDVNFRNGLTTSLLTQHGMASKNIVIEITERNTIDDMCGFQKTIEHYKTNNFRIAIDDVGAGYSGLNLISDVHPDYIKIDMNLIRNIDKDRLKYALVRSMAAFSSVSQIVLIAEGIETPEELETLVNLGVPYGQGYLIKRPDAQIADIDEDFVRLLKDINAKKNHFSQYGFHNVYISNLLTAMHVITPSERAATVYHSMTHDPDCIGMCVVLDDVPVGIITRNKLLLKLSGNYGYSLYNNKPISELMEDRFLSVDHLTPISAVCAMAMARSNDSLYDFIVVTENGKYMGIVTIKVLLQKSTEIEVSAAKHQNPLTGLPGNLLIEQKINDCVCGQADYSVAYLDIDNFKAYNDVYGFGNGDLVIKLLAEILQKHFPNGFVGHVGGDDFVVTIDKQVGSSYFESARQEFETAICGLYHPIDVKNGFIITANRHGNQEKYPLITLTCVVVNNHDSNYKNVYHITETLAEYKKQAKRQKAHFNEAII